MNRAMVCSAYWDIRSFKLNFETYAFVYDREVGTDLKQRFEDDQENHCSELTKEMYGARSDGIKMKETLALLFSDLL